jgi:small-conductance mechanosensitive channel
MRPALRSLATLVVVLVIYYACPTGELKRSAAIGVVVLLIGAAVLARLITNQVRQQLRDGDENSVRIQSLLVLVYLTVLLFALGYFVLADSTDHQFVGIETKTDSLYFTMTTLATVGFGDIHASGQLARALVTLQIAFNLVFVGALASLVTGQMRRRASEIRDRRPPPAGS